MSERDVLLALVDTKLVLGYHYRERAPRSPSVDDANALQGMSAGEFGQAYHLMDVLEGLGESAEQLERRRSPEEYSSMDVLDGELEEWGEFLAACGLADLATVVRLETLARGEAGQLADLARKAVQEEEFHRLYLVGACSSYIANDPGRRERFCGSLKALLPRALRWFGSEDGADAERATLMERVAGFARTCADAPDWAAGHDQPDWADWDERRLRSSASAPPAHAVAVLALEDLEGSIRWERGTEKMV